MLYQLLEVDISLISKYGQYIMAINVMKVWFLDSSYKIFIKNTLPILFKEMDILLDILKRHIRAVSVRKYNKKDRSV